MGSLNCSFDNMMSHLARSYVKFLQQARPSGLSSVRQMSGAHTDDDGKCGRIAFSLWLFLYVFWDILMPLACLMDPSMRLLSLFLTIIFALELRNSHGEMAIIL